MSKIIIETERLFLRRWRESDVMSFAKICADKEVMRFIGSGDTMTEDQARADIDKYEKCWSDNGFGQLAVCMKRSGQFIGFAGLDRHRLLHEYSGIAEIGWRFSRETWGRGYATEAALAVTDFAINDRQLCQLISVCQAKNIASERIMQKIGMSFLSNDFAPNNGRLIKIYSLLTP